MQLVTLKRREVAAAVVKDGEPTAALLRMLHVTQTVRICMLTDRDVAQGWLQGLLLALSAGSGVAVTVVAERLLCDCRAGLRAERELYTGQVAGDPGHHACGG